MSIHSLRAVARPVGLAVMVGALAVANASVATAGSTGYVEGIDVSHWQGEPDWAAVAADGTEFAFIKATESRTLIDDQYATNLAEADAAGVPVGAYHFARPDKAANDAVREANHFVDNAALTGQNLLPVLDLEVSGGLAPKRLRQWAKEWLSRVEERLGVKSIIYTSPSFWRDRMGDKTWFADNGYRLWIAHWGAAQPRVPAQDWGGRGWTVWQYSDCGSVAGIDGCVDRDHLAGTIAALRIKNNR